MLSRLQWHHLDYPEVGRYQAPQQHSTARVRSGQSNNHNHDTAGSEALSRKPLLQSGAVEQIETESFFPVCKVWVLALSCGAFNPLAGPVGAGLELSPGELNNQTGLFSGLQVPGELRRTSSPLAAPITGFVLLTHWCPTMARRSNLACSVIIFGPRSNTKSLLVLACWYYTAHVLLILPIP